MLHGYVSVFVTILFTGSHTQAFYLPGVRPHSYNEGDEVKLKVNKLTSIQSLMPIENYRLPFCKPVEGIKNDHENLGEFLAGDRIENSPYKLRMRKDLYCEQICIANLQRPQDKGISANPMVRAIRRNYHANWFVDGLPSASIENVVKDQSVLSTTKYWHGFPIGYISEKKAYINNHVNILLQYHKVASESKYRIVRFTVEPISIKHKFETSDSDDDSAVAEINNPIPSCRDKSTKHTTLEMRENAQVTPQPAEGMVLFTYDVHWVENTEIVWASRWDIYLTLENGIPPKIHWVSIMNSIVIVIVLSTMIAAVLVKNLRRDFERYDVTLSDKERAEEVDEFGWKLVHADVFRPPTFSPLLLSVFCGNGAQLLCMSFLTITFAALGYMSPDKRGAILTILLANYALMGIVAGYVSARFYKTFKGKSWQKVTTVTAMFVPSVAFAVFVFMNILALAKGSSDAVPIVTMIQVLFMWFGLSVPLVFFGAYFGFKQDAIEFPVNTSSIPRQVPDQPFFLSLPFVLVVGGILPFGACFVELWLIMNSLWMDMYYYVFGFLLITFFILVITCAEITILFVYFHLTAENYHWWWRAFVIPGSTGLYLFGYSWVYFLTLESNMFTTYALFFGYMGLISFAIFLMTGTIGVFSSLWFSKTIFGSIKID